VITCRREEDTVHPMFVELFLEADADDLASGGQQRRRARRARRSRLVMTRAVARDRGRRPQPRGLRTLAR
jgi:hypothetical protein